MRGISTIWHDKSADGVLTRALLFLAAVTAVTAWFSQTFFFPDEHFQIIEFMAMKLGMTAPADLPWEFAARARPFFQPFLYFLIAKPLTLIGLKDPFWLMTVLRYVTGAFSLAALAVFARWLLSDLPREAERFVYARMLPFMGFLPYLFVRTASETASAAFLTLALVAAARKPQSVRALFLTGLLCGAAFECRYQTAFLIIGLFAWLLVMARANLKALGAFTAGGLAILALSLLIDRWGYGVWCFPPWNYIDVNLIQGIAAKVFGTSPWYAYFYLELGTLFAPISLVLMIAMVVAALRNPRHILTWATVPFFIGHSLVGHKEERFLFPLVILFTAYPVLAFAPGRPLAFFDRLWAYRKSWAARFIAAVSVMAMLFLAVYPFGIRPHMKMAQYLYHAFPNGLHAYSFQEDRFDNYPVARPKPYAIDILFDSNDLKAALAKGPVYLFADTPVLPEQAMRFRATRLYSEFAFADSTAAIKVLCAVTDIKHKTPLHPPKLKFLTLFKIEQGQGTNAAPPCRPAFD